MLQRWSQSNGYRQVLAIGLPLVVSMGSTTVIHFTDRIFLSNYAVDAIAAALPAGLSSFLFLSFFMGVASYVNVFVAQYLGAAAPQRVGAALWQGIYFSLFAYAALSLLYFLAPAYFAAGGHLPAIQRLEVTYFRILTLGSGLVVLSTTLSCFYSGRGLTRPVMLVNLAGAALNVPLDYFLIYGVGFFPELGIVGAGLATVASQGLVALLLALLIFTRENNQHFAVWRARAFNRELFRRLMRFGLPGGVQFFLDMFAYTFFVFMVGRLGRAELAATNVVFAINTLSFLPMVGLSIAVSTMVGQAIGGGRPQEAVEATTSALHITLAYMGLVAACFVLFPQPLLELFRGDGAEPGEYARIMALGVVLLRYVAVYTLFDAMAMIYFGALKGAGDIHFVMKTIFMLSLTVMILPLYLGIEHLGAGLHFSWVCITLYAILLGLVFRWRYRRGQWQSMRVIEQGAGAEAGGQA
ncbi:MAG: MATE family efflux transporter [Desulfarculus sp.]|jgi:MATE family multidrug resistance protein|nr:MAG: MATE family efflux transporter [Desulfarculus sp.]